MAEATSKTDNQENAGSSSAEWAVLEVTVSPDREDMICWVLIQSGAKGCEVIPDGEEILVRASYSALDVQADGAMQNIAALLEEYGFSDRIPYIKVKDLPTEDWLAKWKEGIEPFAVGELFYICPVWRKDDLESMDLSGRKVIFIEPGMAFGTGLHATTQYCLKAMGLYKPFGRILDVGTGSGILAIAARLISPSADILAIDNDPVAIENAGECLAANEMAGKVTLMTGTLEDVEESVFDMILSNLTAEDNAALLPDYIKLLSAGGKIICAGILSEKACLLEQAMTDLPLKIVHREESGMWTGLVLSRSS